MQPVFIKTGCNQLPSVQLQSEQNPKVLQLVVVQLPQEKAKRLDQTGLLNSTVAARHCGPSDHHSRPSEYSQSYPYCHLEVVQLACDSLSFIHWSKGGSKLGLWPTATPTLMPCTNLNQFRLDQCFHFKVPAPSPFIMTQESQ